MSRRSNQHGVALFTVVFLIVVVGGLAVALGLISGQQQLTTVQTLEQTRAYYAARARLDREIAIAVPDDSDCATAPNTNNSDVGGFTTVLDRCDTTEVNEDGCKYDIYEIVVRAYRGSADAGTLVQRSIRAQVRERFPDTPSCPP